MANISSVSGTLTLKAPTIKNLAKLLILQNQLPPTKVGNL